MHVRLADPLLESRLTHGYRAPIFPGVLPEKLSPSKPKLALIFFLGGGSGGGVFGNYEEGFNIPHLGRIVHHAVQTPQNVPLATASATKSCRAFFYLLSLHRSFVVKHAGFDCMKSETFIHQSKRTPICRCIQYTIVTSFDHQ